eukprot:332450_1
MAGKFTDHHKDFKLSNNNLIAIKIGNSTALAYSGNVESGVHQWKFKVNRISAYIMLIGVWKANISADTSMNLADEDGKGKFYGYNASGLMTGDDNTKAGVYGQKLSSPGTYTIDMILDLNKCELRYVVDNKDFGVSHKVQKTSYRAAVYAYGKGDSFEIVSYKKMQSNNRNNINEES